MAWIEIHQALPNHRKVLAAAKGMGIEPIQTVGHLVCLWLWALDNAPTGDLTGIDPRVIAASAQWFKKPSRFIQALTDSGFLDSEGDHLSIHDWHQYAGRLIERRRADAERKRKPAGIPSEPPQETRRNIPGNSQDTEPYRTEPNPTEPTNQETAATFTQNFARLWELEMGSPVTPMIRQELDDYLTEHPQAKPEWAESAIKEARLNNVYNLKYVMAILKRYASEGGPGTEPSARSQHGFQASEGGACVCGHLRTGHKFSHAEGSGECQAAGCDCGKYAQA